MKITFLIGTLGNGGAERQASSLAQRLAAEGHNVELIVLFPEGTHLGALSASGRVKVSSLFRKRSSFRAGVGWQLIRASEKLLQLLRRDRPEIVYSFLEIPNYIAYRAVSKLPDVQLVWGGRNSSNSRSPIVQLAFSQSAKVSSHVPLVIFNSHAGRRYYEFKGYQGNRHLVVPNGIDTKQFAPQRGGSSDLRNEWLAGGDFLVGLVGRLVELKGHRDFIEAAAIVQKEYCGARFVCIGGGSGEYQAKLERLIEAFGVGGSVRFVGSIDDVQRAYNALDLVVSASTRGEGFPNVLAEAMSCGVPCISTNAGDSAIILGDKFRVFDKSAPVQMAAVISKMIKERGVLPDLELRMRVVDEFGLGQMVSRTEKALASIID
jgi:glycosyltransferase involved in cell wall biosynthesis